MTEKKIYTGKSGFNVLNTEHFDIRRKIVANMTTESWMSVPHVGCIYEPDATDVLEGLREMNASGEHPRKITVNTLMLRIIVEGIKACPAINSHIKFDRRYVTGTIETYEDINISVPWMLEDGTMITINMHNFESKSLDEMAEYINDVAEKMKNTNMSEAMYSVSFDNTMGELKRGHILKVLRRLIGANFGSSKAEHLKGKAKKDYYKTDESTRLTKADLEQGTITVSNLGSIYRSGFTAAALLDIVPPQVAVIGINAAKKRPAVFKNENGEDEIGIREIMPINISFDHRALDFGDITPFFEKLDWIFQNPQVIKDW